MAESDPQKEDFDECLKLMEGMLLEEAKSDVVPSARLRPDVKFGPVCAPSKGGNTFLGASIRPKRTAQASLSGEDAVAAGPSQSPIEEGSLVRARRKKNGTPSRQMHLCASSPWKQSELDAIPMETDLSLTEAYVKYESECEDKGLPIRSKEAFKKKRKAMKSMT